MHVAVPSVASMASASAPLPCLASATAVTPMHGTQSVHRVGRSSVNAATAATAASSDDTSSYASILAPSGTSPNLAEHVLHGSPSTSTRHAPHRPFPQPRTAERMPSGPRATSRNELSASAVTT